MLDDFVVTWVGGPMDGEVVTLPEEVAVIELREQVPGTNQFRLYDVPIRRVGIYSGKAYYYEKKELS